MRREPDTNSVLQCRYHTKTFLKGVEMWRGKDPSHSLSSSKDTRLKAVFVPTESSCAGRSERCTTRGLLGPTQLG